jgi:cytochrome c5
MRHGRRTLIAAGLVASAFAGVLGGNPAMAQPALATGDEVYKAVCAECHAAGKDKAPKFGDRKDWASRIREGQATLTAEGWVGVRAMPPRGGRADLELEPFARAVAHMARAAGATWRDPDAGMLERIRAAEKRLIAKQGKTKAPAR